MSFCMMIFWGNGMTNHVRIYACVVTGIYSKVVLKGLVYDQFIPRLIRLVVSIMWIKAKLLSITLWLVYDCVKLFVV